MFGNKLRHIEEVPQLELVVLCGLAQASEPVAVLWDDEEMHRGLGADVAERQAVVILIDDVCRNLGCDNETVKTCW